MSGSNASQVSSCAVRDGAAEVSFDDGTTLTIVPQLRNGEPVAVARMTFARDGVSIAELVECGGWSFRTDGLSPESAAGYAETSIAAERAAYKAFRSHRMSKETWDTQYQDFWKISIKSRQATTALREGQLISDPLDAAGATDPLSNSQLDSPSTSNGDR